MGEVLEEEGRVEEYRIGRDEHADSELGYGYDSGHLKGWEGNLQALRPKTLSLQGKAWDEGSGATEKGSAWRTQRRRWIVDGTSHSVLPAKSCLNLKQR